MTIEPTEVAPRRQLHRAALVSLICGLLLCLPLVPGIAAFLLGILGWIGAGRPGMRGRWMAVVGSVLGVVNVGIWAVIMFHFFASPWLPMLGDIQAPGDTTRDFIAALARGDDGEAKKHSSLSNADFAAAKAMVQAQGEFVETVFNQMSVNEGGSGHVSGTARFKNHTLHVNAELSSGPEGWSITSIELLPQ